MIKKASKKEFWSQRTGRFAVSLSLVVLLLSQLPRGSFFSTSALGVVQSGYTTPPPPDANGGISLLGTSVTSLGGAAATVGVATVGVVLLSGSGEAGAAAAASGGQGMAGGPNPATAPANAPNLLPDPATSGDEKKTIFETLRNDKMRRFSQFVDVSAINEIQENPLQDQTNAPYTVFVLTDSAMSALPPAELMKLTDKTNLSQNKTDNQKLLLKYVVLGKYSIRDLEKLDNGFPLATASGDTLIVTKNPDGTVNINGIPVGREDLKASNGVAHPISAAIK